MKMNIYRAQELIAPLKNGTANGISRQWAERLIEALEYVIEHEAEPQKRNAKHGPYELIQCYCQCEKCREARHDLRHV